MHQRMADHSNCPILLRHPSLDIDLTPVDTDLPDESQGFSQQHDSSNRNKPTDIGSKRSQIAETLALLETPELSQPKNLNIARLVAKELIEKISSNDKYLQDPRALDLLVWLRFLDSALPEGNQEDLQDLLQQAALSHLNLVKNEVGNVQHNLDMALEYYGRAKSTDLDYVGTAVLQKLAECGKVWLEKSTNHWKRTFEEGISEPQAILEKWKLNSPEHDQAARIDLAIGLSCMKRLTAVSSKGIDPDNLPLKNEDRAFLEVTPSSLEIIHQLDKIQELLKYGIFVGEDSAAFITKIHTLLALLETATTPKTDDHIVWTAATSFLTHTVLLNPSSLLSHGLTQGLDLVTRCYILSFDLWAEHGRKQVLCKILETMTRVHLQKLMDGNPAINLHHLDAALEYHARLISLDPIHDDRFIPHILMLYGRSHSNTALSESGLGTQQNDQISSNLLSDPFNRTYDSQSPIMNQYFDTIKGNVEKLSRRRAEIQAIIECLSWSVLLTKGDDPELATRLFELALHLLLGCHLTNDHSEKNRYLDQAIEHQAKAESLTRDRPTRPFLLFLLQFRIFIGLESVEKIDWVVELLTSQAAGPTYDNQTTIALQVALSTAFECRFDKTGVEDDIIKAAATLSELSMRLPWDCPLPTRVMVLTTLGDVYRKKFLAFGRSIDIDKAIEVYNEVSSFYPKGEVPATILLGLVASHKARFDGPKDIRDIETSSHYMKELVDNKRDGTVPDIPNPYARLGRDLPLFYGQMYAKPLDPIEILGHILHPRKPDASLVENLNKSAEYIHSTFSRCQDDPILLAHESWQFYEHYLDTDDETCFQVAIKYMNTAIRLEPPGDPKVPTWLCTLAWYHFGYVVRKQTRENYHECIDFVSRALSLLPDNHPNRAGCLFLLGSISPYSSIVGDSDEFVLQIAFNYYQEAAVCVGGDPSVRFVAGHFGAMLALNFGDLEKSLEACTATVEVIPELACLGDTITRRFMHLAPFSIGGIVANAAFVAIHAQMYATGIEWLDQGRSVVWNQVLQLRSPADELYLAEPELAHRLTRLQSELYHEDPRLLNDKSRDASLEATEQKRRRAAEEYSRLIDQIRNTPEFKNFLRPRCASELLKAAHNAPIVVVNMAEYGCDALIVVPECTEVGHVPLPDLSTKVIEEAYKSMSQSLRSCGRGRGVFKRGAKQREDVNDALNKVLNLLWDLIAKPVLEKLGFLKNAPEESLPRLTWCTNRELSMLPLHAAGYYDRPRSKVSDFVISSYTPTLSALLSALSAPSTPHSQLLAIGQETCPSQSLDPLPGTRKELTFIETHAKEPIDLAQVNGSDASCELVLDAMEQFDWVHLACHAKQDLANPLGSGFFLSDGVLTLDTIIRKSFKDKGLAFLSACQTAKGDDELADEAVHLAAGMLLAGYRSVIATMWSVSDADAPDVANEVYGRLLKDGKMDHTESARALHEAINVLRESVGEKNFIRWVPYIHIGA
ncbi:Pentafunctional AROM polypeptide [Rhizoctonia solani]|uniref:Pentafunctional AROM polypeptide n=1 Tax=Rhizoctonia solani TaxID=456999 RepID=A0A0K6G0M8_9AGAM|nr:Pentafunctional AROM polypeptide [Rhizoctonia solani]